MADLIPGRALVYTRRLVKGVYHGVARHAFAEGAVGCSDWGHGFDDVDLMREFYPRYRRRARAAGLSEAALDDIVARCRLLRRLPRRRAERMAGAMHVTLSAVLDRVRPAAVLSVMVDSYVVDLLHRLAGERGIPSFGFCLSCYPDHSLVTLRGEFNKMRDAAEEEVDELLRLLLDDEQRITYNVAYGPYTLRHHLRNSALVWSKVAYFGAARLLTGDGLNFRYLTAMPSAEVGFFRPWNYRSATAHADWEARLARAAAPPVFVPLAHIPEATTNYWLSDLRYVDYERFVLDLCLAMRGHYTMVVKEHWFCRGVRAIAFYERLKRLPHVILVPPEVNSRAVMARVDRVLVGAGTSGLEAALRGKRVAVLGRPYYHLDGPFVLLRDRDHALADLPRLLEARAPFGDLRAWQRRLARQVLDGTLPGVTEVCPQLDTEANYRRLGRALAAHYHGPHFAGVEAEMAWRR